MSSTPVIEKKETQLIRDPLFHKKARGSRIMAFIFSGLAIILAGILIYSYYKDNKKASNGTSWGTNEQLKAPVIYPYDKSYTLKPKGGKVRVPIPFGEKVDYAAGYGKFYRQPQNCTDSILTGIGEPWVVGSEYASYVDLWLTDSMKVPLEVTCTFRKRD